MRKKNIGDYLAPEIKVTAFAAVLILASSQSFGEEGRAGSDLVESGRFTL